MSSSNLPGSVVLYYILSYNTPSYWLAVWPLYHDNPITIGRILIPQYFSFLRRSLHSVVQGRFVAHRCSSCHHPSSPVSAPFLYITCNINVVIIIICIGIPRGGDGTFQEVRLLLAKTTSDSTMTSFDEKSYTWYQNICHTDSFLSIYI